MSIATISVQQFESAWDSAPQSRFSYELNMPLMILYAVLLTGFWCYWTLSGMMGGFDIVLILMGAMFGCVTVWVLFTVIYWRRYGRMSAVVCTEDDLIWRHGDTLAQIPWRAIDFDSLGLFDVDISERKYEHHLKIGDLKLYLYRPHVRMRNMEGFIQHVLLNLKSHGRIPQSKSPKKGSSPKGASKGNTKGKRSEKRR